MDKGKTIHLNCTLFTNKHKLIYLIYNYSKIGVCISVQPKYAMSSMLLLDYISLLLSKATSISKEKPNPLLLLGQEKEPT